MTTPKKTQHYGAGLRIEDGNRVRLMLSGYPACCCGARAQKIREAHNLTASPERVTCKKCLMLLEAANAQKVKP